ncbi:hypothetical protein [Sphingobacterium olei]|nr:hypothetical protein [Sphingobacterium olei]
MLHESEDCRVATLLAITDTYLSTIIPLMSVPTFLKQYENITVS